MKFNEIKLKLKRDQCFVANHCKLLNNIFIYN